jgi:hypothetical protein
MFKVSVYLKYFEYTVAGIFGSVLARIALIEPHVKV